MKTCTQEITLHGRQAFGSRPPSRPVGEVLRVLPVLVRRAVRMAFEGRSTAQGPQAPWLRAASDLRFVGLKSRDDTTLLLEAPSLGEAAGQIYSQQEFWPARPDPCDTGLDLLVDTLADVAARKQESDRFDPPLLKRIAELEHALNGTFQRLTLDGRGGRSVATVDQDVISTAQDWSKTTPGPQAARVVGKLEMIRVSTRSFALKLDGGDEVRGVLDEGDIKELGQFLQEQVMVLGQAVFRPSGRLLRIDAREFHAASKDDRFFAVAPTPHSRPAITRECVRRQGRKEGIAAMFGQWPGDETDERIREALEELS